MISVVVPTYRRQQLLGNCLRALAAQVIDKSSYELIVVSDGPDPSLEGFIISLSLPALLSVKHFALPEKQGPAAARNAGWQQASGELVAFTDDDCLPDKNWLATVLKSYKGQDEVAYSGRVIVPLSGEPTDHELNTANLERAEFITANCICTKQALQKTGGFDERFALAWREDSDLQFKLKEHHVPVIKLNEAIVVHPVRKAPWGFSVKEQRKGMFDALLYKKYPTWYRESIRQQPPWNYYIITFSLLVSVFALWKGLPYLASAFAALWFILTLDFIRKRLERSSHAFSHVVEMILTSLVIPFLSIYWHWYGAIKFKVFFI